MRFSPASQVTIAFSRQAARQLADQPLRQDRLVVGEIGALIEIAVALAMAGDPALGGLAALRPARLDLVQQLAEDHRGVADQHVLGRVVPRRVARLDVDLDKGLPRRVEQSAVLPGGVAWAELRADDQHQIGLGDSGIGRLGAKSAEHAQGQRMGFGKAALAGRGRRHRQPGCLGQSAQLVIGLGDAHAIAGDQHRPLRGQYRRGGGLDLALFGRRRRHRQVVAGRVQHRLRIRRDIPGQRIMAVKDRDRPRLARRAHA